MLQVRYRFSGVVVGTDGEVSVGHREDLRRKRMNSKASKYEVPIPSKWPI